MSDARFADAQKGIALADAMPCRTAAEARKESRQQARAREAGQKAARRAQPSSARDAAAPILPAPAALSIAERLRILDGFETVIGGVYTHLPLKRARYGFDPVQRLRILRIAGRRSSTTTRSTSSWRTSSPGCATRTRATPGRSRSRARWPRCRFSSR